MKEYTKQEWFVFKDIHCHELDEFGNKKCEDIIIIIKAKYKIFLFLY